MFLFIQVHTQTMGKAARFMSSLRLKLKPRGRGQKEPETRKGKSSGIVSWFSTSDLDMVADHSDFLLDDSGIDVISGPSTPPQGFVTSLINRLKTPRRRQIKDPDAQKKRRFGVVSWFSTSDLDHVDEGSFLLLEDSGLVVTPGCSSKSKNKRDSGYISR